MVYFLPVLRPTTYSRIMRLPMPLATPGVLSAVRVSALTRLCIRRVWARPGGRPSGFVSVAIGRRYSGHRPITTIRCRPITSVGGLLPLDRLHHGLGHRLGQVPVEH